MKSTITSAIMAILFAGTCLAQVTFSVKPGLNLLGADFGYRVEKFEPYIGLKSVSGKYTYEEENSNTSDEVKVTVLLPHLGIKIQLSEKESIKTFLNLSLYKPLIFGKMIENGQEDEDFKDEINRIKTIGFEAGFTSEYFFDEQFSLGGEFGLRYAIFRYKYDEAPDPYSVKLNLNMTYALISFNYYF